MYSIVLPDGIESDIQSMLWIILAIFFVMIILSWLVASRGWFKDDEPSVVGSSEEEDAKDHKTGQASSL